MLPDSVEAIALRILTDRGGDSGDVGATPSHAPLSSRHRINRERAADGPSQVLAATAATMDYCLEAAPIIQEYRAVQMKPMQWCHSDISNGPEGFNQGTRSGVHCRSSHARRDVYLPMDPLRATIGWATHPHVVRHGAIHTGDVREPHCNR